MYHIPKAVGINLKAISDLERLFFFLSIFLSVFCYFVLFFRSAEIHHSNSCLTAVSVPVKAIIPPLRSQVKGHQNTLLLAGVYEKRPAPFCSRGDGWQALTVNYIVVTSLSGLLG